MTAARPIQPDERRQHQRVAIDDAVAEIVYAGGARATLTLENMSEGGALFTAKIDRPVGALVEMSIRLSDLAPVVVVGKIVRHQGPAGQEKSAVAFQSPPAELRERVHELVLRALMAAFPDI